MIFTEFNGESMKKNKSSTNKKTSPKVQNIHMDHGSTQFQEDNKHSPFPTPIDEVESKNKGQPPITTKANEHKDSKASSTSKSSLEGNHQNKSKDDNYNHEEPFAFEQKKKTLNKDSIFDNNIKSEIFDNLLNPNIVNDLKKVMDNCVNSTARSISNAATITNTNTELVEEILSKLSSSVSNSVQENIAISQDLLACKDAKDVVNFQQKIFETNFSNIMNLYLGISSVMQNFASKTVNLSSDILDKNIKNFTKDKDKDKSK